MNMRRLQAEPRGQASRYEAATPWSAWAACVATLCVVVAGLTAAASLVVAVFGSKAVLTPLPNTISLIAFQIVVVGSTVGLAGLFGGQRSRVLALDHGWPSASAILRAFAGMLLVLGPINILVFVFARETIVADLKPFQQMVNSPAAPLLAIALVIGAPLSEEMAFRGFLQSALAKSRVGFMLASWITTFIWTALHFSYSFVGLTEVFLIGLYFSWLLWTTGNLWLPILCHGAYNGLIFVILLNFPLD